MKDRLGIVMLLWIFIGLLMISWRISQLTDAVERHNCPAESGR